jgi:hypothetical protein
VYKLDFETLKRAMAAHQKTGILFTEVPAGVIGKREAHIEIILKSGKIASCELQGSDGWSKRGQEAEAELARLGQRQLAWTFTPMSEGMIQPESQRPAVTSPLSPGLGAELSQLFPRRTGRIAQGRPMRSWLPVQKLVYGYIDGTRSVANIVTVLSSYRPEQVVQAVTELESMGVIEIISQKGKFR